MRLQRENHSCNPAGLTGICPSQVVLPGPGPGIHGRGERPWDMRSRRGWPGQARPRRPLRADPDSFETSKIDISPPRCLIVNKLWRCDGRYYGNDIDLLQDLIGRARRAGADAADAVLFEGISLSHGRRLGKTEKLERSEGQDLGLRVFIGRQQAVVSSSDRSPKALDELVARAVEMARAVPEDPFCGIADPAEITRQWPALDMSDPEEPSAEVLIERARAAEEAALAVPASPIPKGRRPAGAARGWRSPPRTGLPALIPGRATGSAPRSSAARAAAWSATTIIRARSTPPICATPRKSARVRASAQSSASAPKRCRPAAARSCSTRGSRAV